MICRCAFCGADDGRPVFRSRINRSIAICAYCMRSFLRQIGEAPDPTDGVIDLASRRAAPLAPLIRIPGAD